MSFHLLNNWFPKQMRPLGFEIFKFRTYFTHQIQQIHNTTKLKQKNLWRIKNSTMRFHLQSKSNSIEEKEEENNHENSSYYPGCKKNANCKCEYCIASINATLDLIPNSTLTKFSSSKPSNLNHNITPISIDSSIFSTPEKSYDDVIAPSTPVIKSSAKSNHVFQRIERKKKGEKRCFYSGLGVLKVMMVFGVLLFADVVLSRVVSVVFQPSLSEDIVKRVGEKCHKVQDLNGKLKFLQKELGGIVNGKVSNCSFTDKSWEISQVLYFFVLFIKKVSWFAKEIVWIL